MSLGSGDGLIVNIFKKGDREDPGNYRGITLLSVVGKVFCKILNNRLVQCLDKEGALHEGQAVFRLNRGCMDNVYTLNEIVQGRLRENKKTYAFFLDIQKAYDTVWHDGLWYKLWDMGVKGRMWRVIKKMYMSSRSAVLLEGEKSDSFNVDQGVAQGCSLSPILFSVFINDLLKEVEQAELGIQLSSCKTFGGMLFADDFVGVSDSKENLQKLIDVVYSYCSKWRLRANVIKSAVMVFSKDAVNGCWKWGEYSLPKVSSYSYLGIDFSSNGAWDMHIKKLLDNGTKKVNQLHKVISNRNVNLSAHRLLLLSVIRPSIEYGSEVWEGNKSQARSLESIILDGAKRILGCSSKTCNEAVRGDMGLDTLQSRRDRAKLKWWYKLASLPEDRYPKQLFNQEWNIKPRRGRQRKVWSRMVDDLFKSLDIDKGEWLEDIEHGDSSSASFLACVEECISDRESRRFEEGLNTKVKLDIYKRFGKSVEFKKYLHGVCDAGSRLLFKFRSGTMVDDLFKSLDIDKGEWLEDIERGDSSSASFLACVEECISDRESRRFEEGLNTKVKLDIYKRFGKSVEFKKYLHGVCDAGSRLLFKFRSGTHGLNEELGRHRGREGKTECSLCGDECENVSHVLWECSAYSSTRACFIKKLQELLEDEYEDFESLDMVEKSSYVLGSELWESKFDGLLSLVKEYITDVWEIRKQKLYDSDSGPGQQLHSWSSPGERNGKFSQNGKFGQNGKLGHSCTNVTKGKLYGSRDSDHAIVHLGLNVSSSAHNCGCVVDGGNAMAAI